jgi:hypothetical protein
MAVVKDWRGITIKVGSTVVYPSRQGSNLWMNEGEVIKIENEYRIAVIKNGGKRISYPDVARLTVVS